MRATSWGESNSPSSARTTSGSGRCENRWRHNEPGSNQAASAPVIFITYGATLAEPALNALGDTVERITVGAFRKKLLMQSVAVGVGFGIAIGILKIIF